MTRHRLLLLLLTTLLTVPGYVVVLGATGFLACGISGCSGGGFGPSYGPVEAQVGLGVAGLALVPVALVALHSRPVVARLAGAATAALAGTVLAMALLDLGPDGCPAGTARVTAGPDASSPGEATCARDRDALR